MTSPEVTGKLIQVYGWSCRGVMPRESLAYRIKAFVSLAGLTPVAEPVVWGYPLDGKGGFGETVYLPFGEGPIVLSWWKKKLLRLLIRWFRWAFLLFQPFTESFMAIDTYPQRQKIAVVLVTCMELKTNPGRLVNRFFGSIEKAGYFEL
jgi:hypothetical protein